jgi:hypothetical protein
VGGGPTVRDAAFVKELINTSDILASLDTETYPFTHLENFPTEPSFLPVDHHEFAYTSAQPALRQFPQMREMRTRQFKKSSASHKQATDICYPSPSGAPPPCFHGKGMLGKG